MMTHEAIYRAALATLREMGDDWRNLSCVSWHRRPFVTHNH